MSMQGGQSGQWKSGEESMSSSKMGMGASQISMYLKNMDFPTDKQKIVDMAKSSGAPETVIMMLNKLPNKQYMRSSDVEEEFNKMK